MTEDTAKKNKTEKKVPFCRKMIRQQIQRVSVYPTVTKTQATRVSALT